MMVALSKKFSWSLKRVSAFLWLFFLLAGSGGMQLFGQSFENLDGSYKEQEPSYFFRLALEYLDNDRDVRESGYEDLSQKQFQKEGRGSLKLYFFNLDASYKAYDSKIRIGADKTAISDVRDSVSAWVEFLTYLYLFAQKKDLDWEYSHIDDGNLIFFEHEKAATYLQGIGVVLGDWRLGVSPGASFKWSYRVDIEGQSVIQEDIEFETSVYELVKKATNKRGPFYELGLKKWVTTDVKNNREGSLERTEASVLLGMGFSKNTGVYLGEKISQGNIKTILLRDGTDAIRKSDTTNQVQGIRIGIGEARGIYLERQFLKRRINFENISYENTQHYQKEKLAVGAELTDQFSVELTFGETRIEKRYIERAVANQAYRYRQTDNLVGISVSMQFSE